MAIELPLNGFYSGESWKNSSRRCINWIPTQEPEGSLSAYSLYPTAGITGPFNMQVALPSVQSGGITSQVVSFNTNTSRKCIFAKNNRLFAIDGLSGSSYLIPNNGFLVPDTQYARFASSQDSLVMVSPAWANGNTNYACSFSNSLSATVIDLSTIFGISPAGMIDVAYLGGRFIWLSDVNVSSIVTAFRCFYSEIGEQAPRVTNFFSPDSATTRFTGLHVVNGSLLLFTEDKTFVFTNTASTTTPFQWQKSSTMSFGLVNPHCKDSFKGSVVFLGRREDEGYKVMLLNGSDATPISSTAIDFRINEEIAKQEYYINTARVFTFSEKGRDFTAVKVGELCFVYDHVQSFWHERRSGASSERAWDVNGFAYSGSKPVFVSSLENTGANIIIKAGIPKNSLGTEFGSVVERSMISAPFGNDQSIFKLAEVEPVCETDIDTPVVDFPEPKISISVSRDFGRSWEGERALNLGGPGAYSQRTRFFSFGMFKQAVVIKFRTLQPYPIRLLKMAANVIGGVR